MVVFRGIWIVQRYCVCYTVYIVLSRWEWIRCWQLWEKPEKGVANMSRSIHAPWLYYVLSFYGSSSKLQHLLEHSHNANYTSKKKNWLHENIEKKQAKNSLLQIKS